MRVASEAADPMAAGLAELRDQLKLPGPFAADVEQAAAAAVRSVDLSGRTDRRDLDMATLDPAGSTDLDQAYAVELDGDNVVLSYAIADVSAFVPRGSAIETEAWQRGETLYAPDGRVPLYPEALCQGAASLLPGVDRPAVLLDVVVDPAGIATLRSAARAVIHSRTQLAYEHTSADKLPAALRELYRRISVAEDARGAERIEFPEQELVRDDDGPHPWRLSVRARQDSEDVNAAMSLAANLAVAQAMCHNGMGLFRVIPDPPPAALRALRKEATSLGIAWTDGEGLRAVSARLDATNPVHVAFLLAARRAGGRASYALWKQGEPPPRHAAVAAIYAHATAPLRRLADRYVLDLVVDGASGSKPSTAEVDTLARLPAVMERSDAKAGQLDRAAIDLVEAVLLADRVGETFGAVVLDGDGEHTRIQLDDPPVRAIVDASRNGATSPGQRLTVRLTGADQRARRVELELT
jgi:exoribonuclease R